MSKPKKRRLFYFTPEQEKQFNQVTVPGTNVNSNTIDARKTGVQAQNFQAQEAARKDAEIESRSDRKTVKRQTTVGKRLRGDNGYSSYMSAGTPMSGWDPALGTIFDWTVGAKGIDALSKTALWNFAKYGPSNQFRGLARNYFINNAFKQELRNPIQLSNRTISVKRSNNEITGQPDLIYTLYNEFGEPIGQTNIGGAVFGSGNKTHRMVDGVMSMRNAHKVSEDTYNAAVQDIIDGGGKGLESGWSLMMPQKTLAVTSKFPHEVIGQEFGNPVRLLTGTSKRPIPQKVQGAHYLEKKPSFEIKYNESTGNFEQVPITNQEPYISTSLKFFERKPSRISFAERLGIPKGDRGNLNQFQKDALEDLQYYIKQGQYRQSPSMINGNIVWGRTINTNPETLQLLSHTFRSPLYKGAGVRANLRNNFNFDVSVPSKDLNGGEATLHSYDSGSGKFILTSPKTAASIGENDFFTLENAPETLPKSGMKTFWTVVQETRKPGTYFSGDFNREPLGSNLIREFKNNKTSYIKDNYGNETKILPHRWDGILKELFKPQKWFNRGDNGLSTDSYLALLKQAKRKDSPYLLRYSPDGAQFNDRGVENKFIYDLLEKTKTGEATQQEFLDAFHNWVSPYGGMDARIINGEIVIPHPFLYKKKQGGKLKINNTDI